MTKARHYYAGIGSRKAPKETLDQCQLVSSLLENLGFVLRSGGAVGCDQAFEKGVISPKNKEIFRPKGATTEAKRLAGQIHPAWDQCDEYAKNLHGRNIQITLGLDLTVPVKFVICWTPEGEVVGGSRTAMVLAIEKGIPIFNLAIADQNRYFMDKMKGL